jgi:putative Holliday junction resolvase
VRFLGIDYGSARTGLALSDPLGVTCRPLAVLSERDQDRLIVGIVKASKEQQVGSIVVGLPRPLSGETNQQMRTVLTFVERLGARTVLPVLTWDERFTTSLAEKGRSRNEDRDAIAACYMLQSYLDALTNTTKGG